MTTDAYPITDWDDAYANGAHIEGSAAYPDRWTRLAGEFRSRLEAAGRARLDLAYGPAPRNRLDLFLPDGTPDGLVVFVHGGYWKAFDKSFWSHLAAGAVEAGWAVAMPSYTLAPEARIAAMAREIAEAVAFAAAEVEGPIRLAGHSAGGHLVTRLMSEGSPLDPDLVGRIAVTFSISGLHDLRPLMLTDMNAILAIDDEEARSESPALLRPLPEARLVAWAGTKERPEFRRQNRLLPMIWDGFGVSTHTHEEPGRQHFDIIDGLTDPVHPLTRMLLGTN